MNIAAEIRANREVGARRLVAECGNRLYETAIRLCGDAALAEDYTFRTLERAIERIDDYSGKGLIFTWLYRILVNFIGADRRRKGFCSVVYTDTLPEVADETVNPAERTAVTDEAIALRLAIEELVEPLRDVVVFRYYEDLTVPEIAEILCLPEGTVKSRLYFAKRELRRKIAGC